MLIMPTKPMHPSCQAGLWRSVTLCFYIKFICNIEGMHGYYFPLLLVYLWSLVISDLLGEGTW